MGVGEVGGRTDAKAVRVVCTVRWKGEVRRRVVAGESELKKVG